MSSLRGKGWVYRNWRLEWTCVEILRGLNWGLFWNVYWIIIFLYDYKYNIVVFDGPIDVRMRIGWWTWGNLIFSCFWHMIFLPCISSQNISIISGIGLFYKFSYLWYLGSRDTCNFVSSIVLLFHKKTLQQSCLCKFCQWNYYWVKIFL